MRRNTIEFSMLGQSSWGTCIGWQEPGRESTLVLPVPAEVEASFICAHSWRIVGSSWFLFRLAAAVIVEPNETFELNDESVARFEIPTAVLLKIKSCRTVRRVDC
jgi:hypothetical protein